MSALAQDAWLLAGAAAVVAVCLYAAWALIDAGERPPRHARHGPPGRRAEVAPVPAPARLALPPGGREPAREFWAAPDDDAATETWLATSLREPARGGRDAGCPTAGYNSTLPSRRIAVKGDSPGRRARPSFTAAADLPRPGLGAQGEPATGTGHPPEVSTGPGQPGVSVYVPGGWAPVRPYPGLRDLMNDPDLPRPGTRSVATGEAASPHAPGNLAQAGPGQPDDTVIEGVVMDRTWIDDILRAPWVNGELVIRHG